MPSMGPTRSTTFFVMGEAVHAAILLHQLFQIELRCDLGHIALTVLIRRIDSRQPHPLFIERSEEHTSELQSLMRSSYAGFCLQKKRKVTHTTERHKIITINKKHQSWRS